jgi:hypothetical protein
MRVHEAGKSSEIVSSTRKNIKYEKKMTSQVTQRAPLRINHYKTQTHPEMRQALQGRHPSNGRKAIETTVGRLFSFNLRNPPDES